MKKTEVQYTLYLVTDRDVLAGRNLIDAVEEALAGGITLLQLREKNLSSREFYQTARQIKTIANKYRVPLIINDRLDIAMAIDADGLHIGQSDLPLKIARKLWTPDKIIGVSAANPADALIAEKEGADYLGVGAIFPTPTKQDADSVTLSQLAEIKTAVSIPVVAIGGINAQNARSVIDTGVDGISVVSAILGQKNIRQATADLLSA
jgi:thiamine-phosphate pyrophosphorylase